MKKTRQEMAYDDAVVEYLHEHKDCEKCDGDWCFKHATKEQRTLYAKKYGCICGVCCVYCKDAKECGLTAEHGYDGKCSDCDIRCGLNPNYVNGCED